MPELVQDDRGLIYDTEQELVAAMDHLLGDPSYRRQLGLRGYHAYRRKWTTKAHLKGYFGLIREIAAARGQPLN
jgi:hypothetical protein